MLSKQLIDESYELIKSHIYNPPLQESIYLSNSERKIYFKNEGLQYTKSFKLRGALSKILRLTDEEKQHGVVAISSGNHGIAVSYICQKLGIDNVMIFVPSNTPKAKTEKIAHFGAKLIIDGANYDEAHAIGMKFVNDHKMTLIDSYDRDPYVYAGQGTIALEILREHRDIDTMIVPIGGGGMITGIATYAKALNPNIKIIGVQTEACPAMKASMDDQVHYAEYPTEPSICEALVGGIGKLAYEMSEDCIDDVLLVKESSIKNAVKHMLLSEKIVAEPSSCVTIAALMDYPDYPFGENVALIISGNNIDENLMMNIIR